jgi:hypothetical protein
MGRVGTAACFVALGACAGSARSYRAVENPSVNLPAPIPPSPVEASKDGREDVLATAVNAEPPPAPEPLFGSGETVSYRAFVEEVRRVADELAAAPEVERSYHSFLADYQLLPSDVSVQSYSRIRLLFEATRDGGLWGVRWTITDRMPWSDAIWEQWRAFDVAAVEPDVTAVAECDELSALFAFLARDVGVQGFVGLFWPAWNHTVAVWELRRGATPKEPGTRVRVMVPTSQIWLSREATLGSREFKTHRAVFPYARKDLKPESELSVSLARFLIERLERYGGLSNEALLERRNRLGGS